MRISDWSSDVCSSALLSVGLLDPRRVWFHLVLRSEERAVQVALPGTLDKQALRRSIEAGLKRFAPGALRTVALSTPAPPRAPGRFARPGADKIGSASCRERVCRAVLISGGAAP